MRSTAVLGILGVALVGILWTLEAWLLQGPLLSLDVVVHEWGTEQRTPGQLAVARAVSRLGELWVVAAIAAVLVVVARVRSARWDAAQLVIVAVGGALLVTGATKMLTGRMRPDDELTSTISLAFPSGHASRAAVIYVLIAWLAYSWVRQRGPRIAVGILAGGLLIAAGWSRVLLGAHWPTDVLAGWALGLIWLAGVMAVLRPAVCEPADRGAEPPN